MSLSSSACFTASASVLDLQFDFPVSLKDLHHKLRQIVQQKLGDVHCMVRVTRPLPLSQIYEMLQEIKHQFRLPAAFVKLASLILVGSGHS